MASFFIAPQPTQPARPKSLWSPEEGWRTARQSGVVFEAQSASIRQVTASWHGTMGGNGLRSPRTDEMSSPSLANPDDGVRVGRRRLVIPSGELEWRFSSSGGPGGQHANTANTRAELVFDIANSSALTPRQRALLLERLGPTLRVVVSDERSQARNRQIALERLAARLDEALRVERPRRPTVPTLGSRERRLRAKQLRSTRKRERRPPPLES